MMGQTGATGHTGAPGPMEPVPVQDGPSHRTARVTGPILLVTLLLWRPSMPLSWLVSVAAYLSAVTLLTDLGPGWRLLADRRGVALTSTLLVVSQVGVALEGIAASASRNIALALCLFVPSCVGFAIAMILTGTALDVLVTVIERMAGVAADAPAAAQRDGGQEGTP